jgi:hypothetical protein
MISTNNIRGVVHGKTIELASDPGLKDGEMVEVTLRPATPELWGGGVGRSAGALADSWHADDDKILDRIQQERTLSSRRQESP